MKRLWLGICLCVILCLPVSAESAEELYTEQLEASGIQDVYDSLSADTQRFLQGLGIYDVTDIADTAEPSKWLSYIGSVLNEAFSAPLQQGGALLAVILMCALMNGMQTVTTDTNHTGVFYTISLSAVTVALLPAIDGIIQDSLATSTSLYVFAHSFVPIYIAILITSGQGILASGYQGIVLLAIQIFSWLQEKLVLPIATVSFAMGIVGGLQQNVRMDTLSERLNKCCVWGLSTIASLFVGMLSIKSVVGAATDTIGRRVLKLSVAGFIPIVGGALSETVNTVVGCVTLTRTYIGVFGWITIAAMVIPIVARLAGWMIVLGISAGIAEVFALDSVTSLLKSFSGTVKILLATLCIQALFMIITIAIVSSSGGTV